MLPHTAAEHTSPPATRAGRDAPCQVVLKPLSHPQLDEIRIEEDLFAIGRTEPPFVTYERTVTAEMSRRHARLFLEHGAAYVADLDSKNGTTINGVRVRRKPQQLHDGDELCFGGDLSYRVALVAPPPRAPRTHNCVCLTLSPERDDLGLQPIVITSFPFLVSKADEAIARYRKDYPHQVNYVSRRHAHIFLKGGAPFVEDLGSTNGTFVDGQRLDEHAAELTEGCVLAFGGMHFVYRVGIQRASESTLTRMPGDEPSADMPDADKTTFVGAPDSFLDIFCVDDAPERGEEGEAEAAAAAAEAPRERARWRIFLAQLREALGVGERRGGRRLWRWGALALVALVAAAGVHYLYEGPRRALDRRMAAGDFAAAAELAHRQLAGRPEDAKLQAIATEALLRASVPQWSGFVDAGQFGRADTVLGGMRTLAVANPDALALVEELAWVAALARFVDGGGADAPFPLYGDEHAAGALIRRWDADPRGHQRALSRIATLVPEFKDRYALALSQLRGLQSDAAVYLAAIERLEGVVRTRLESDDVEGLEAVFREYEQTYPRLTGFAALREDLARYRTLERDTREAALGERIARFDAAAPVSPPFQEALRRLRARRLPGAEGLEGYRGAGDAWRAGDAAAAIAGLQALSDGRWRAELAGELAHKQAVAERFAALGEPTADAYRERLLALAAILDPAEDAHFVAALAEPLAAHRVAVLERAQALIAQAAKRWDAYREAGPIGDAQRREGQVSEGFRGQARRLAEAHEGARQGLRMAALLELAPQAEWTRLGEEIGAELERQRGALLQLGGVLGSGLMRAKLALLEGGEDEE